MKSTKKDLFLTTDEKINILFDAVKPKTPLNKKNSLKKFIVFFGSSGVGKTSTIMKLALKYRQKNKVAIISLSNLKNYSDCVLTSFCIDTNIEQIKLDSTIKFETIQHKLEKFDMVLIDTVGRAPCEAELKFELQMYKKLKEVSFLLVLPSNLKYKDYIDSYNCYKTLKISNIVVSKIDETKYLNSIIKFLNKKKTPPISFISTGRSGSFNDNLVEY